VSVWTAADAAELDVLLWELTGRWFEHRDTCPLRPCPHLRDAIETVLDWRQGRILRTRAEQLRLDRAQHALYVARDIAEVAA
jgi:hypothetical protein